jgi:hypothetical protein
LSSSLVPAADNLNTIYLYNVVRGQLQNIPAIGTGEIWVSIYSASVSETDAANDPFELPAGGGVVTKDDKIITGSYISKGVYSASFAYTGSSTTIYPVWHTGSTPLVTDFIQYHTGSGITVKTFTSGDNNYNSGYVISARNLKYSYFKDEEARIRIFSRENNWTPTIYTVANANAELSVIPNLYYSIRRIVDNLDAISFGTGSTSHTKLSYDNSGSYFDLDMSLLEPGYLYELSFLHKRDENFNKLRETFKFRVEKE